MKISGVDIRPGNIMEYEGGIWKVAKIQHTQPGKGGAYMQVEMKNLIDGRKTNVRFPQCRHGWNAFGSIPRNTSILYAGWRHAGLHGSRTITSRSTCHPILLGDAAAFLEDGMDVTLEMYDETADQRCLARTGGSHHHRRSRCRGEGTDRLFELQTGNTGKRRACHGPAAYRKWNADRGRCVRTYLCRKGELIAMTDAPHPKLAGLELQDFLHPLA